MSHNMTGKYRRAGWLACVLAATAVASAQTPPTEVILHNFGTSPPKGGYPSAVILDPAGNLYGTAGGGLYSYGVIFKVDPSGNQTVLYNFTGGTDGGSPSGSLLRDPAGNLYGVTSFGGAAQQGVLFMLDPSGVLSVLHSFTGGNGGLYPNGGLVRDPAGNFYGTTNSGGPTNFGIVYMLDAAGDFTILHRFSGGKDGASPYAGLVRDSDGNLYGTASRGGTGGCGVVFRMSRRGTEYVLYNFTRQDGCGTGAGVVLDSEGNLYGTTGGGADDLYGAVYKLGKKGYTILHAFHRHAGIPYYAGVIRDSAGNLYGATTGVVYKLGPDGHYTQLYEFQKAGKGLQVYAGVVRDSSGNLYGTTLTGGVANQGMVYKIPSGGQYTVLYQFPDPHPTDGGGIIGGVVRDSAGNLYGTAIGGGTANGGIVYKLDATGHETILYNFTLGADGAYPWAGVIRDAAGNLYGTTANWGGAASAGVVYKLDTTGNETVLYTFTGGADGSEPFAGLALDAAGNVYGTTEYGGTANAGVVFMVDPSGQETVLYSFSGGTDGGRPGAAVILDAAGNIYGTTISGGTANSGVVYKVDSTGNETVLYSFTGGPDGGNPIAGVTLDAAGSLYGTASAGGAGGAGVVYKLDATGGQTVLYSFTGGADGGSPFGGVTLNSAGNIYGTAVVGGTANLGVAFSLDASGNEKVLHSFLGGLDGAYPNAGIVQDSAGNLYGTTYIGGYRAGGVAFEIQIGGAQ
jgi:uncharacterized repeat protein (TIGR03803 family)